MPSAGSPSLRISEGDLRGLDRLDVEALAVFCWADARPLAGVAGYLDWRLCGALSRLIEQGLFAGRLDEVLLMPVSSRLRIRRLFVFGLGSTDEFGPAVIRRVGRQAVDVMRRAGVADVCFAAPQRRRDSDGPQDFKNVLERHLAGTIDCLVMEPA